MSLQNQFPMKGILIFEDNKAYRQDLIELIKATPDYLMLASFENCAGAGEKAKEYQPEVILMDIEMPEIDGLEGIKLVRAVDRNVPIIMLTAFDDSNHVFDAICAGASGYLLKSTSPQKLFEGIEEVLHGGAPMSPTIAMKALQLLSQQKVARKDYQLTPKETAILELLVAGNSYKMIASTLSVGKETVKTHIRNIYEKLEVNSSTEAVSKAIKENIV